MREKNELKNRPSVGQSYGYRDKVDNKVQPQVKSVFNIFK